MKRFPLPILIVFLLALLAGCGNKGPLTLPSQEPAPASGSSTESGTESATEDEQDDESIDR